MLLLRRGCSGAVVCFSILNGVILAGCGKTAKDSLKQVTS
jgi:hypothetical protein